MIDLAHSKGMLKVRDLYFAASAPAPAGEDIQSLVQAASGPRGAQPFYTSVVDLRLDETALMARMRTNFAYEIRRAGQRDGLSCPVWNTPDDACIGRFCAFYAGFATARQLRAANAHKLALLARTGSLAIAAVFATGAPEVWLAAHVYLCDGRRARLLYSAGNVAQAQAAQRQLVGRANKLLHWEAMRHFRAAGYAEYDLGGISKSEQLAAIDDFKNGFGGAEAVEYNALVGVTLLGKLAVAGFALATRLRGR
jgi:hypothetical protein